MLINRNLSIRQRFKEDKGVLFKKDDAITNYFDVNQSLDKGKYISIGISFYYTIS